MLERLRGVASASEPRTQNAIYELGFSVMNPVLVLLEVYKHEVYFLCIRVAPMCAFNDINLLILKKKILLKTKKKGIAPVHGKHIRYTQKGRKKLGSELTKIKRNPYTMKEKNPLLL
jgi:hypothetical protein